MKQTRVMCLILILGTMAIVVGKSWGSVIALALLVRICETLFNAPSTQMRTPTIPVIRPCETSAEGDAKIWTEKKRNDKHRQFRPTRRVA